MLISKLSSLRSLISVTAYVLLASVLQHTYTLTTITDAIQSTRHGMRDLCTAKLFHSLILCLSLWVADAGVHLPLVVACVVCCYFKTF